MEDFYLNRLLKNPERFADFFNAELYGGEQVLKAIDLEPMDIKNGIPVWKKGKGKQVIQRQRDVLMKADFGACFAILGAENQHGIHYAMPVRVMLYDSLEYTRQIQDLEKMHQEHGERLTGDEFLSGITKDDRIFPVVTIVLYYGKEEWNGSKSLYEMMGWDQEGKAVSVLKKHIPDYKINLVSVRNIKNLNHYHSSLQYVFGMLKYSTDKDQLYEYAQSHRNELRQLDRDSMMAILELLGEKKRILKLLESQEEEEGFDLCQAIDELIKDGEKKGEKKGEKQGENRMSSLILELIKHNRQDLIEKAASNRSLRAKLYKEYHL